MTPPGAPVGKALLVAVLLVAAPPYASSVTADRPEARRSPPGVQRPATQDTLRLDRLSEVKDGDALPPGWELRSVEGERLPRAGVETEAGIPALVLEADAAAGQAWLELADPLEPEGATLSWEWRVDARPSGIHLRSAELDDAPARLFVVFGGGGLFGRPRFLFYTWGEGEEKDEVFFSHVSDRVAVVVVRNDADPLGRWHTERRSPADDFRRAFDRDPDEIRAVGLMADTDQTGQRAVVRLRSIRWEPRPPAEGPGNGTESR